MTIVDIAKEAGYSVSTVSRVLNGRRDVSEEARDRIMRIVEAYQFVPNNLAVNGIKVPFRIEYEVLSICAENR